MVYILFGVCTDHPGGGCAHACFCCCVVKALAYSNRVESTWPFFMAHARPPSSRSPRSHTTHTQLPKRGGTAARTADVNTNQWRQKTARGPRTPNLGRKGRVEGWDWRWQRIGNCLCNAYTVTREGRSMPTVERCPRMSVPPDSAPKRCPVTTR